MTVNSGTRTLELKNILVGDVWLCSGQSNMSWKLEGTDDSVAAIAAANYPTLKILSHPDESSPTPRSELMARAEWEVCTPETVKPFSAVAFYFGRKLSAVTGIPIGLISSNQGGTKIEPWTGGPLYNARIHPYTRLPIKGVIWYQGEANLADGAAYTDKLVKMVRDWRAAWGLGDFPFFYVQVAPFKYENQNPLQLPELWEGQTKATQLIPNSGMVVINDVGNVENIHPLNKATVGERLARWALNKTYGHAEILTSGPMVRAVSVEGQRLRVSFYYTDRGLASRDGKPLSWFEVAGVDETYVKAEAVLDGDSVLVSAPTVPSPTWVRFAWQNIAEPNLMNKEGLPANSFRMKVSKLEN
jgi:sialate O-acetylesterase